jgi:hypothetical protein
MGLEGYKTEIWAGFRLLWYVCPWLISSWTEGKSVGRSNRTGDGMALYQTHIKA